MNSTFAYRLETERLSMRAFQASDAHAFRDLLDRNDRYLRPWIPWMCDEPMSLEDTRGRLDRFHAAFLRGAEFRYAMLEDERLVGHAVLHPRAGPGALEIGYLLDKGAAGRGLALEATAALVRVAFDLHGVVRVDIHCAPENVASARIPEKLGFTHVMTHSEHSPDSEGVMRDSMHWTLEKAQYNVSPLRDTPVRAFSVDGRLFGESLRG